MTQVYRYYVERKKDYRSGAFALKENLTRDLNIMILIRKPGRLRLKPFLDNMINVLIPVHNV